MLKAEFGLAPSQNIGGQAMRLKHYFDISKIENGRKR